MAKFTGYARSRGFQNIPVRDKSRQIQQRSQDILRGMEATRQRNLQVANQHLQDVRDKQALEQQTRQINEQIRREYASAYIDAFTRNADAQVKGQLRAIDQKQGFVKDLIGFSQTLLGVAEQQNEKFKTDKLNQANVLASRFGLTAEQFQQLQTLKGVLDQTERETAPIYEDMLRRGATADDLNTLISASGFSKYAFSVASMQQSGAALDRYLTENGNEKIQGFTTSLNAAEQQGLPEYNDILLRMQQDFVVDQLAGFDPAFIAEHAKPSMDRTLARRQDYARTVKQKEDAKLYDATRAQEFATLAETGGAAAVLGRLQDLTGPDKTRFKTILARNAPVLSELLEQGSLPDNFVTDLANQPLQIGNQQQSFGSLHSVTIDGLRIAEAEGKSAERKAIQAEYQLARTETKQLVRNVVSDMTEKARNGELQTENVAATIQEMQSRPDLFEDEDISKIKAFLPKTPDATAATNIIRQWDLSYKRDRQLPSIPEISASPLLPEQKLEWYDKVNKEIEAGLDDDQKSRRDLFLKGALMRELKIADATMDQWGLVHPSVHNVYFRLQQDYDDLFSSDLTQNLNTRHEQAQAAILSRLPAGGSDNPLYTFDGDGFEGKVTSLALPESSPSELTTSQVDDMLKDGNENRLYTQQIVPTSILDNYLDDLSSGKRVQMPEAISYISRKLGVSPMLVLEAQMDVATASDKKNREINLPEDAEQFYDFVKGTPNSSISRYVQSRYHSRNRASRALISSGLPDPYTNASNLKYAPQSHTNALNQAAAELGVDPLDLATIIGFESAGSYSPDRMGGYNNAYMGLIQFGPEEQRTYGVTRGMTFEEQLLGPVVQFFKDRFAKEGMSTEGASLLQLYTTVLAGNPNANVNAKDSFGTSSVSGVERMQKEHREAARIRFFSSNETNAWSHPSTFTNEASQIMGVN
jgi:hypothetical protein